MDPAACFCLDRGLATLTGCGGSPGGGGCRACGLCDMRDAMVLCGWPGEAAGARLNDGMSVV